MRSHKGSQLEQSIKNAGTKQSRGSYQKFTLLQVHLAKYEIEDRNQGAIHEEFCMEIKEMMSLFSSSYIFICTTLRGRIKGKSRDTSEILP